MYLKKAQQDRDIGAVSVVVVAMVAVFIGLMAVSIEYAQLSSYRASVQNAADGAALEIARVCAENPTRCDASEGTRFVNENAPGASIDPGAVIVRGERVELTVSMPTNLTLARVFDRDSPGSSQPTVRAGADVQWEQPIVRGRDVFPFGIGACQWRSAMSGSGTMSLVFRPTWGSATLDSCTIGGLSGTVQSQQGFRWVNRAPTFSTVSCRIADLSAPSADFNNGTVSVDAAGVPTAATRPSEHVKCRQDMMDLRVGDQLIVPVYRVVVVAPAGGGQVLRIVGLTPVRVTGFVGGDGITCNPGLAMSLDTVTQSRVDAAYGTGCTAVNVELVELAIGEDPESVHGTDWERGEGVSFGTAHARLTQS